MTDATSAGKKPRRAEPLQPDLPVRGDDTEADTEAASEADESTSTGDTASNEDSPENQSKNALENVRNGYD